MSLLTIIQDAADELGIPRPASVVGNADQSTRQLLALAKRVGKALASDYAWTVLQKEATFTTVNGQDSYAFPSDFDRFIDRTQWDRSKHWELRGPESPQEWQWIKSGIVASGPRRRYRVKGSSSAQLFIHPTPTTDGDTLVFEYISKNWVVAADGVTYKASFTADNDNTVFDDTLLILGIKLKFFEIKGFPTDALRKDFNQQVSQQAGRDGGSPTLSMDRRKWPIFISPAAVPDTGFGMP